MARMMFGGGPEDVYLVLDAEGDLKPGGGYPAFFYDSETGGSQLVDLLTLTNQPTTYITTSTGTDGRASGQIPPFFGPDNLFEMWCSVNSSPRFLLQASNLGGFAGPLLNQLINHLSGGLNPHQTTVDSLADVNATSTNAATPGQALVMGPSGLWIAGAAVSGGGGGSGDATLAGAQTFTGAKTFSAATALNGGTIAKPLTSSGVGLIVQGLSSQAGNLQEWKDSTGAVRSWVGADYGVYAPNSGRSITFSRAGALATGTGTFRWVNDTGIALTIRSVRVSLGTPSTSGTPTFDVNVDGTTIYTTQSGRPTVAVGASGSGKNTAFQVTKIPNGSYLTADVDVAGSGVADATIQIDLW